MMTTLAEAQRDLANFGNVLARVRGEIISGNHVDLSGLPERTEALCREIESLPHHEGQMLMPLLTTFVRDYDALAERLTAQHQRDSAAPTHR